MVAGELDENDRLIETDDYNIVNISLSKDKIEEYKDLEVKKMFLSTSTVTAENGSRFVKIFENYGFKFHISIEIISDELN